MNAGAFFMINFLFLLLFLICLFGLVIPIFPGLQLMWGGMLIRLILEVVFLKGQFNWVLFTIITILMVIGTVVDNVILTIKLRKAETPWFSILGSYLVGFISGVFLTPLIALITTPLALLMFETIRLKEIKTAMVSVREWLFSVGWIFVIRFGIGILMISAWGIAILIVN
jgi:uncharacterized protein YqgC (DUF456 family)